MVSDLPPDVESVTPDGSSLIIKFTQYMDVASLQSCVSIDGLTSDDYTIVPLDAEIAAADFSTLLARTVRIDLPDVRHLTLRITELPSYTGQILNYTAIVSLYNEEAALILRSGLLRLARI
jgi:uncharacterized HAD superfamily protein